MQAAQTRKDVVEAAIRLFSAHSWGGTTLAAVAEEAGVAVETIYNAFGSKKALLRAALDAAVVGDLEPVPFAERPEFLALDQGNLDERIARGIAVLSETHGRSARVWRAMVAAASGDPEFDELRVELDRARRLDVRRAVERILGEGVDDALVTTFWLLYAPEVYLKLVVDEGLSPAEYEAFMVDASTRLVPRRGRGQRRA
jgi:AcrR family transcriptional regulator